LVLESNSVTYRRDPQGLQHEEARLRLLVVVANVVIQKVAANGQHFRLDNRLVLLQSHEGARLGPRAETVVQNVVGFARYPPGPVFWSDDALRHRVRRLHVMAAAAQEKLPRAIVRIGNILVPEEVIRLVECVDDPLVLPDKRHRGPVNDAARISN
jgi:hypothetical protein